MRLPLLLISLIILSNATLLPAQVYKWVDNEGKTHYGDKLQSNASETVHIRKKAALDSNHQSRSETTTRLLNVLDEERNEKKKLKVQTTKNKRELAAKCIRAKKELEEINKMVATSSNTEEASVDEKKVKTPTSKKPSRKPNDFNKKSASFRKNSPKSKRNENHSPRNKRR